MVIRVGYQAGVNIQYRDREYVVIVENVIMPSRQLSA